MSQVGSGRSGAAVGAAGPPSPSRLAALRRGWPAHVVLACTLLLTFAVWRYAERTVRASREAPSRRKSVASLVSWVSRPFEPP
mgnify:CR=1 FL=1